MGLALAPGDRHRRREVDAALVGSQLLGLAVVRYILCIPSLAGMDDANLIGWLRPVITYYLAGPAPGGGAR
jgi:Tetracyclin repressor-like, C-terminal domain